MGNDYCPWDPQAAVKGGEHVPPVGVGERTFIEGAIVDKNCRIGRDVTIKLPPGFPPDGERGPVLVRDGVICVPKEAVIPDGWTF
jgi:glucose-1-phosphate adenylyltransferase